MTIFLRCLASAACVLLAGTAANAQQKTQTQLRGFSVVLLQGDQQDRFSELPAAARAAIDDVKDFLPFKSYSLLDSSWTLASNAVREYSSRLRGDSQDYEVRITSNVAADSGRVEVKFSLQAAGSHHGRLPPILDHLTTQVTDGTASSLAQEEAHLASLEAEAVALRKKVNEAHPDAQRLQSQIAGSRRRLDQMRQQVQSNEQRRTYFFSSGSIIDTSFSMRLGETVVVGTSRVGGDKALIALLTAVPRSGNE